jgi:hypothetical protein
LKPFSRSLKSTIKRGPLSGYAVTSEEEAADRWPPIQPMRMGDERM